MSSSRAFAISCSKAACGSAPGRAALDTGGGDSPMTQEQMEKLFLTLA